MVHTSLLFVGACKCWVVPHMTVPLLTACIFCDMMCKYIHGQSPPCYWSHMMMFALYADDSPLHCIVWLQTLLAGIVCMLSVHPDTPLLPEYLYYDMTGNQICCGPYHHRLS
eukprot:GHRR01026669.1.p2 GENE.GHRR01026669.1~~GHRR01026669.1.p2  ORF type:complete len:112 (-),score=18.65 GHRR01026669.1:7-342(-)